MEMPSARITLGPKGMAREMCVGQDNLVSVAHIVQDGQQLGSDVSRDSLQHSLSPSLGRMDLKAGADGHFTASTEGHGRTGLQPGISMSHDIFPKQSPSAQ